MRMDGSFASIVLSSVLGLSGLASARPIDHFIRNDVMIRAAADGRADTAAEARAATVNPAWLDRGSRPDRNVGQQSHFALPVKNDIQMRVSLGDGRESAARGAATRSATVNQPTEIKGFLRPTQLPVPLKNEIVMQVTAGGDAAMNVDTTDKVQDDPKLARIETGNTDTSHRNPKVYPGRHEIQPSVVEQYMSIQKRQSAQGDTPGDKDAP